MSPLESNKKFVIRVSIQNGNNCGSDSFTTDHVKANTTDEKSKADDMSSESVSHRGPNDVD